MSPAQQIRREPGVGREHRQCGTQQPEARNEHPPSREREAQSDGLCRRGGGRIAGAVEPVDVQQPDRAIAAARAAIPADGWIVGALHSITTLTGSALLALALQRGFRDAETIWRMAHVDEDWNFETWGFDHEAMTRRTARETEFNAAVLVLQSLA